ncbi:serine O-acetyltransferase [Vagococcus sp. WN89Y]|uniref:serine O-acetyltransferase n=1 Tax=Vagococcus sp. WN89Y TaxID=3457258 RepID=UPI003FCD50C9
MFEFIKSDIKRYNTLTRKIDSRALIIDLVVSFFCMRLTPVILYRMSSFCYRKKIPFFSKLFSLMNFIIFGIEIAPNCEIGGGLFIPHSQGIVIGAAKIGCNATIYQNVTLGAKNIDIPFNPANRPVLGNDVLVASGAKVLGGIHIGNNVIIAANAVVTKSCEDNVLLAGVPAVIKRVSK